MSDKKIQNVDLSALNGLSPEERKVAIEMLKEIADTGKSELLEKMKYGDFEEIPVDIHTFLHDRKYLETACMTKTEDSRCSRIEKKR